MNRYAISTPDGTRDRLFSSCRRLRQTEHYIRDVLENRGYKEVITPSIEYYDVFLKAGSSLGQEMMFKMTDRSGRLLVLRPDNTTPIARIASTKIGEQVLPQRLYYIQNVFRSDADNDGHSAEIMQAGAELLGAEGIIADLDIITAAFETLESCNTGIFRIELGHAGIYKALITELGADEEASEEIRRLIETKSFAALGDVLEPFKSNEAYRALKAMPTLFGGIEVLAEAQNLTANKQVLDAISYLRRILEAVEAAGYGEQVMIDLGLVHQIDYYTGMMFRGYMGGAGAAILSGGRYDCLCAKFGKNIPATGFAVDMDGVSGELSAEDALKPEELIYADSKNLKNALDYIKDSKKNAVLAPCDTRREAEQIAIKQGFKTLVIIKDGTIDKAEVRE